MSAFFTVQKKKGKINKLKKGIFIPSSLPHLCTRSDADHCCWVQIFGLVCYGWSVSLTEPLLCCIAWINDERNKRGKRQWEKGDRPRGSIKRLTAKRNVTLMESDTWKHFRQNEKKKKIGKRMALIWSKWVRREGEREERKRKQPLHKLDTWSALFLLVLSQNNHGTHLITSVSLKNMGFHKCAANCFNHRHMLFRNWEFVMGTNFASGWFILCDAEPGGLIMFWPFIFMNFAKNINQN